MTSVSTLGQALDQIERIRDQQLQFATLSNQIASGKKTQGFSGLKADILVSQRARADFRSLDAYINNITNADRRIKLMLSSIKEFQAQARNFLSVMGGLSQESVHQEGDVVRYDDPLTPNVNENTAVGMTSSDPDQDLQSLRQMASGVLSFLKDLVNTQENDRYLFGGAETLAKPLNDNGSLDAALGKLINDWKTGTITTDDLMDDLQDRSTAGGNTDALTDTIVGYSSPLSAGTAGKIFIRISETAELDYTTLANDKGFRDILVAASYVVNGELTPIADSYIPPNAYPGVPDVQGAPGATNDEMKENFFAVFNKLIGMVNDGIDRLDTLRFTLENTRARITETRTSYQEQKNVLLGTIGEAEDVDTSEVAVRINGLQVQIEASLAVTARMQELSLVNFLFR